MVEEILRHLAALRKEEETPELPPHYFSEETIKAFENYGMDWENLINRFRTSEAAAFLREEYNRDNFDKLWNHLLDIVHWVQKLLPDIMTMYEHIRYETDMDFHSVAALDIDKLPPRYRGLTGFDAELFDFLYNLRIFLKNLVMMFKENNEWYIVKDSGLEHKIEKIYDFFGSHITKDAIKKRLLTTQQWRDLYNNKYIQVNRVHPSNVVNFGYHSLKELVDGAEKRLASIEGKLSPDEANLN